jgi:hypothetical protein
MRRSVLVAFTLIALFATVGLAQTRTRRKNAAPHGRFHWMLTHEMAEQSIRNAPEFKAPVVWPLTIGNNATVTTETTYLRNLGYIEVNPDPDRTNAGPFTVTLTPKAQNEINAGRWTQGNVNGHPGIRVPVVQATKPFATKFDVVEDTVVMVTFDFEWLPLNDIGKAWIAGNGSKRTEAKAWFAFSPGAHKIVKWDWNDPNAPAFKPIYTIP